MTRSNADLPIAPAIFPQRQLFAFFRRIVSIIETIDVTMTQEGVSEARLFSKSVPYQ